MEYIYLISIIIGLVVQNAAKKTYKQRVLSKGTYLFCGITSLSALVFFIATSKGFEMNSGFLPYSIAFAISYAVATVSNVLAISWGTLSLTNLIVQLSLVIPIFFGLVFLKEPVKGGLIPGLITLLVSLLFINSGNKNSKTISFKWLVAVLLACVGNGMCVITQKMLQVKFQEAYKNEFMIIALGIVVVILFVMTIATERKDIAVCAKQGWLLAVICGLTNGMVNLFVLILNGKMPVSLMQPLISAGGIVATYAVARFVYKEKLSKNELIGFIIGIFSVVLLNI